MSGIDEFASLYADATAQMNGCQADLFSFHHRRSAAYARAHNSLCRAAESQRKAERWLLHVLRRHGNSEFCAETPNGVVTGKWTGKYWRLHVEGARRGRAA